MVRLLVAILAISVLAFGFVGCGGRAGNKVIITVKFKDGTPLPRGTVTFISTTAQFETFGTIGEGGVVDMGAMDGGGVPNGTYDVAVSASTEPDGDSMPTTIVDLKYSNAATSGLQITIDGDKEYTIEVEKAPGT